VELEERGNLVDFMIELKFTGRVLWMVRAGWCWRWGDGKGVVLERGRLREESPLMVECKVVEQRYELIVGGKQILKAESAMERVKRKISPSEEVIVVMPD